MWGDHLKSQKYRSDTLQYVADCLRIELPGVQRCNIVTNRRQLLDEKDDLKLEEHQRRIIRLFDRIGKPLREAYSVEQRLRFFQEMDYFIRKSEEEQRLRLDGHVPTMYEFWNYRLGSSAVSVCLAVAEFTTSTFIPDQAMNDADMRRLWDLANILIST